MTGNTDKKAHFENVAQVDKRNDNEIDGNEKMCVYLESFTTALELGFTATESSHSTHTFWRLTRTVVYARSLLGERV